MASRKIKFKDDYVEADFLIVASNENVFHRRKSIIQQLSGFNTNYSDSYEKTECKSVWRILSTSYFNTVDDIKNAMNILQQKSWFFDRDSYLLYNGNYIFSEGRWLI